MAVDFQALRYAGMAVAGLLVACGSIASAQTVQLPSYNFTTVGTTVSVPDGGAAYMGGIYRASEGSTTRGAPFVPFKNRAIGRSVGASSMSMHVTIIDHAAMDEALLAEAAARRASRPYGPYRVDPVVAAEASYLSSRVARSGSTPNVGASSASASGLPLQPAAPHAAASVHAAAARESRGASTLADKLFRSEIELGGGANEPAQP